MRDYIEKQLRSFARRTKNYEYMQLDKNLNDPRWLDLLAMKRNGLKNCVEFACEELMLTERELYNALKNNKLTFVVEI